MFRVWTAGLLRVFFPSIWFRARRSKLDPLSFFPTAASLPLAQSVIPLSTPPPRYPTVNDALGPIPAGPPEQLRGRALTALSQAVSYGADAMAATNYPLVRLRNPSTGKVWYCRTSGHSTMGVGSSLSISTTNF